MEIMKKLAELVGQILAQRWHDSLQKQPRNMGVDRIDAKPGKVEDGSRDTSSADAAGITRHSPGRTLP